MEVNVLETQFGYVSERKYRESTYWTRVSPNKGSITSDTFYNCKFKLVAKKCHAVKLQTASYVSTLKKYSPSFAKAILYIITVLSERATI